jgi:hypothetical protein
LKIESTKTYATADDGGSVTVAPDFAEVDNEGVEVEADPLGALWCNATGVVDIEAGPGIVLPDEAAAIVASVEQTDADPLGDAWLSQTFAGFAS